MAKYPLKKKKPDSIEPSGNFGRSERTRTSGLFVPNEALYHLSHTPITFTTFQILMVNAISVNEFFADAAETAAFDFEFLNSEYYRVVFFVSFPL